VKPQSGHMTTSRLLWVENTYMLGCGQPVPLSEMERLNTFCKNNNMKLHLDGARLLNASVALGVEPYEITKYADSVQMCLSKGIGAPFGSVLLGDKEFIDIARKCKQAIGGGLRQAGIMAAAGVFGLENYKENFAYNHKCAKDLANGLYEIFPECVNPEETQTNMVLFDTEPLGMTTHEFGAMLKEHGINALLGVPSSHGLRVRMMTYPGITEDDVALILERVKKIAIELGEI
ncbi:MAG: beta-eliminating lyase-related protein, partial [Eubacteriales bacterium]